MSTVSSAPSITVLIILVLSILSRSVAYRSVSILYRRSMLRWVLLS